MVGYARPERRASQGADRLRVVGEEIALGSGSGNTSRRGLLVELLCRITHGCPDRAFILQCSCTGSGLEPPMGLGSRYEIFEIFVLDLAGHDGYRGGVRDQSLYTQGASHEGSLASQ